MKYTTRAFLTPAEAEYTNDDINEKIALGAVQGHVCINLQPDITYYFLFIFIVIQLKKIG
jgi:hypothetical protein